MAVACLVLFVVICFCAISVTPRSILPDEVLQLQTQNVSEVKPGSIAKIVWTKLEGIPRQDIQQRREESISGVPEENLDEKSSKRLHADGQSMKLSNEAETTNNWRQELHVETELPLSNTSEKVMSENSNIEQRDELVTEEKVERPTINFSSNETFELFQDFESSNFSNSVMNILNRTRDLLGLQSLSEIGNITESFVEAELMNDGSEIAVFQDVSTTGFEFLVDSETTKNLLLAELLTSESLMLSGDGDSDDSTDDDLVLETTHFTFFREDENDSDNSTFDIDNLQVVENQTNALSENKPKNITESIESETKLSECPPPGWCVFWFMTQDTCAKDSHCLGSRICCKSGCSKTCLDVPS